MVIRATQFLGLQHRILTMKRVRTSLLSTGTIARVTLSQVLRDPAILIIVAMGIVLTCAAPAYAVFDLGEVRKVMIDTGLSTALLAGLLVAILGAIRALAHEVEDRTALTVLSKPVSCLVLVAGKFMGVALASGATVVSLTLLVPYVTRLVEASDDGVLAEVAPAVSVIALCALVLAGGAALLVKQARAAACWGALTMVAAGGLGLAAMGVPKLGPAAAWRWEILGAGALVVLEVAVIAAVATAAATRLGTVGTAAAAVAVLVAGHARALAAGGLLGYAGGIVPGLEALSGLEAASGGLAVGAGYVGTAALYAGAYCGAAVLVGGAMLSRREMT